ncbi:hypothetical protein SAMN05216269_12330 [Flavobacterium xinjiangense]|uniref:Uncharacterized protein n=1 Tax=Flavobacterium xinjiangense TaxID=178356 RepID=A0A1M7PUR6_9FLAO|nr:hypothetical protein SAMN05216269_12330 [Flavobacterium xinjiangense]
MLRYYYLFKDLLYFSKFNDLFIIKMELYVLIISNYSSVEDTSDELYIIFNIRF